VGLERDPLSLASTIEELLGRKRSGSCIKIEITAVGDRRTNYATPVYPLKLELISQASSVGVVRSWTQATEFFFLGYFGIRNFLITNLKINQY
jgi:hypothetical protein